MSAEHWIIAVLNDAIERCWPEAQRRAANLRERNPGATPDAIANLIIEDHAFWAAVVGVGVGSAALIPVVGQLVAAGAVAPELVYLTRLHFETALAIAAVYEYDMPLDRLKPALLACIVYSMGLEVVRSVIGDAAEKLSRRAVEELFKGAMLSYAKKIANQMGVALKKKALLRAIPVVAIPVNASMNYAGLTVVGKASKHFFSPTWQMCARCAHIQPRKNKFCSQCAEPSIA